MMRAAAQFLQLLREFPLTQGPRGQMMRGEFQSRQVYAVSRLETCSQSSLITPRTFAGAYTYFSSVCVASVLMMLVSLLKSKRGLSW